MIARRAGHAGSGWKISGGRDDSDGLRLRSDCRVLTELINLAGRKVRYRTVPKYLRPDAEQIRRFLVIPWDGRAPMTSQNERVELEMKILKYRDLARLASDIETRQHIEVLVAEMEQKLREIDE